MITLDILNLQKKIKSSKKDLFFFYYSLFEQIKNNKHYNFYNKIFEKEVFEKINDPLFWDHYQNQKLFGIPFFLKDNFNVKNYRTSGGSKILKDYHPNFDAHVLQLLEKEGAILIGKTVMDELSMGGTGLESCDGDVFNPFDPKRICGGSSSGSAVAIALKLASFALGTDTGDSVRAPASYLGIYGFKPTFGLISRFGIIQYAPSLDTIGFFTNHINDIEFLLPIFFQYDQKDFIMKKHQQNPKSLDVKKVKILILGTEKNLINKENLAIFQKNVIARFRKNNVNFKIFKLPSKIIDILNILYKIISYPEALSTHGNLTGINFGIANQAQKNSYAQTINHHRTQNLGEEVKRRYFLATQFIDQENQAKFFLKGAKIRRYLENYFQDLFQEYHFILHPSTYDISPLKTSLEKNTKVYRETPICNDLLLIANFLGLPSLSIPYGKRLQNWLSLNIFGNGNYDFEVVKISKYLDKIINKGQH